MNSQTPVRKQHNNSNIHEHYSHKRLGSKGKYQYSNSSKSAQQSVEQKKNHALKQGEDRLFTIFQCQRNNDEILQQLQQQQQQHNQNQPSFFITREQFKRQKQQIEEIQVAQRKAKQQPVFEIKELFELNQNKHVQLDVRALNQNVRLKTISQDQPVLITLRTSEKQQIRKGVNLVCVVDHSQTMFGQKLNSVKLVLSSMVMQLTENDSFCLIQFNDRCDILPLTQVTDNNRSQIMQAIHAIQASRGQNIYVGLSCAYQQLSQPQYKESFTNVLVFTDCVDEHSDQTLRPRLIQDYPDLYRNRFTLHTFSLNKPPKASLHRFLDGDLYFVENSSRLEQLNFNILSQLLQTCIQDLQIKVTINHTPEQVIQPKLGQNYQDKWESKDKENMQRELRIPQMVKGDVKNLLIEVKLPPFRQAILADANRQIKLLTVSVVGAYINQEGYKVQFGLQRHVNLNLFGINEDIDEFNEDAEVKKQLLLQQLYQGKQLDKQNFEEEKFELNDLSQVEKQFRMK